MVGTSHDSVPVAKDPVLAGQSQRDLHLQGICVTEFVYPEWPPAAKSTTLFCWGWWFYGPENSLFYLVFSFMVGFMGVQCLSNRPPKKTHIKKEKQQDSKISWPAIFDRIQRSSPGYWCDHWCWQWRDDTPPDLQDLSWLWSQATCPDVSLRQCHVHHPYDWWLESHP